MSNPYDDDDTAALRELVQRAREDGLTGLGFDVEAGLAHVLRRARAPEQERLEADAQMPALATLRSRLGDLAAAEAQAKTAYDKAFDKIANPKLPPLAIKAPTLLDRLGTLDRRVLSGQPPPASELGALSDEITKAGKTARQRCEQATALVDQRDQLRKRLDCYHAMAGHLRLELPEADKRYHEAHTLLWTKPCQLDAATRAVDAYQQSVIAERDKHR